MTTLPPVDPGPAGLPWERRDQIGFVPALVETTQQVLTGPEAFFRGMPVTGGITPPLLYAVLIGYAGIVATTLYSLVFHVTFGGFGAFARRGPFERFAPYLETGVSSIVNLVFGPVLIAVALFIWAGLLHLILMVLGGARRDFEATFRVVGYSQAAAVFEILPVCGGLIAAVYGIVLSVIGLSHAHGISKGQAAAAVLIPIVVLCCCCLVGVGLAVGGLAAVLRQVR